MLELGAHVAVAVVGLSLRSQFRESNLERWSLLTATFIQKQLFYFYFLILNERAWAKLRRPHPLVGAPASGQHEEIHFPLLFLLLDFPPLLLGDDVVPFPRGLVLEVGSALLHAGKVGYLQRCFKNKMSIALGHTLLSVRERGVRKSST